MLDARAWPSGRKDLFPRPTGEKIIARGLVGVAVLIAVVEALIALAPAKRRSASVSSFGGIQQTD